MACFPSNRSVNDPSSFALDLNNKIQCHDAIAQPLGRHSMMSHSLRNGCAVSSDDALFDKLIINAIEKAAFWAASATATHSAESISNRSTASTCVPQ